MASKDTEADSPTEAIPPGKRKVLEAAFSVFAQKGFARSSTAEIAKKAGVAEGTIFKYFPTKKELFLRIGFYVLERLPSPLLVSEVKEILKTDDLQPREFVARIMKNRIDFGRKHPEMIRLLMQEVPMHPELLSKMKQLFSNNVGAAAMRRVQEYIDQGKLRDIAPERALRMAASLVVGYLITSTIILPERKWDDESEINDMLEVLFKGLAK